MPALRDVHSWSIAGPTLTLWLILTDGSIVAVDLEAEELLAEAYPTEVPGDLEPGERERTS